MDTILNTLNLWRESTGFAPVAHALAVVLLAVTALVGVAVQRDDLLADLRDAIRHAGLSDKQVAAEMHVSKGLCSLKLHGGRPMTLDALSALPAEVFQWLAVQLAQRFGLPDEVQTGVRLSRQARMQMPHKKAGAA